jgi:hypothetical protein
MKNFNASFNGEFEMVNWLNIPIERIS